VFAAHRPEQGATASRSFISKRVKGFSYKPIPVYPFVFFPYEINFEDCEVRRTTALAMKARLQAR